LCKHNIIPSNHIFVEQNHTGSTSKTNTSSDNARIIHPQNTKLVNLEHLVEHITARQEEPAKIIVAQANPYHHSFLMPFLKRQMYIEFLKGNKNTVNKTLSRFKHTQDTVLFMHKKSYGAGLNLQDATDIILFHKLDNDIEKQIIGRAQRSGRKTPLRLWYLLHDTEMHSCHRQHFVPSLHKFLRENFERAGGSIETGL